MYLVHQPELTSDGSRVYKLDLHDDIFNIFVMIKQIALLGIIVLITSSQNTVTPKTQQCEC